MIRYLAFAFCFVWSYSIAQVSHDVTVGGGGSSGFDPYYNPQFLTIEEGDTVRWTNIQGTHNVDGSLDTYPGNPTGFYSGEPTQNWVFEHVFTIAGSYGYECSQGDHALTQYGIIMVSEPNSVEETIFEEIVLYPNPAVGFVELSIHPDIVKIEVRNAFCQKVNAPFTATNGKFVANIQELERGFYYCLLYHAKGIVIKRFIKI